MATGLSGGDGMERFEYQITKHEAESFKELAFFCSESGQCRLEEVPGHQTRMLEELLNARGLEGWELVQMSFGKTGIIVFWKRKIGE